MNASSHGGDDVALFIDWENFKISLAVGHRMPNVSALKEEVSNHGRVVVARAYADWVARAPELRGASQFINDPPALYAAGIEPVYVPTRLAGGNGSGQQPSRMVRIKNSVDVKMTADCIESAHSYPNIGTYVLVSGDSDFIHVINTLRAMGKRVIIIGVSWSTSRRLADQVDGLILYDVDVDPITPHEPTPTSEVQSATQSSGPGRRELPEVIRAIEEIVRHEREAGGTPLLTSIKQRLMRRFPGFDEKKLGFSGFKKLMQRVAQEGCIRLTTAGLVDWAVMTDEPDPKPAPAQSPTGGAADSSRRDRGEPISDEVTPADLPADHVGDSLGGAEVALPDWAATIAGLDLSQEPEDDQDAQRVADIIVMADTLENRQEVSHVAFNFLVTEICQALDEGLKEEHPAITQRWGQAYSRSYVTKMIRGLGDGKLFEQGWHTWRDQATGHRKRRRTIFLNRDHPLVQEVLKTRWDSQVYMEPEAAVVSGPDGTGQDEATAIDAPSPPAQNSFALLRMFRSRRE